ncbi:hypothetical protein ABZ467_36170 [Streptomyces sp. NPDC005727]|uniref:hypothetical protein n=1 Tax=Streptomyces sp. NPDC005727 TaxID=3157053 RepID=UPI0034083CB2
MKKSLFGIASTVILMTGGMVTAASPAHADSTACNQVFTDVPGEVLYNGNGRDVNLPATLHGKKVRLYNGRGFNQSYATVDNPSPGDIVSIDRALDSDKRNTTKKWWRTDEIRSWEYCQANTDTRSRTPTMNNWHVPMRVCLRHNGALQCSNIWYADQS